MKGCGGGGAGQVRDPSKPSVGGRNSLGAPEKGETRRTPEGTSSEGHVGRVDLTHCLFRHTLAAARGARCRLTQKLLCLDGERTPQKNRHWTLCLVVLGPPLGHV